MPKALKTREEKAAFRDRVEAIRLELPDNTAIELNAFCRYTQRDTYPAELIYNVLRVPIRRYDDEILESLEKMVKVNQRIAA